MEKKFLEIIETVESETANSKIVSISVANKAEAQSKIANAEKGFEGKKYTVFLHYCRHNANGKNQPCTREVLKKVDNIK